MEKKGGQYFHFTNDNFKTRNSRKKNRQGRGGASRPQSTHLHYPSIITTPFPQGHKTTTPRPQNPAAPINGLRNSLNSAAHFKRNQPSRAAAAQRARARPLGLEGMAEAPAILSLSAAAVVEDVLRQHGCRFSDRDLASRRAEEAGAVRAPPSRLCLFPFFSPPPLWRVRSSGVVLNFVCFG